MKERILQASGFPAVSQDQGLPFGGRAPGEAGKRGGALYFSDGFFRSRSAAFMSSNEISVRALTGKRGAGLSACP